MTTDWQKFRWLYFGLRGAIDRRTFILSWLLPVIIEIAILMQLVSSEEDSTAIGLWFLALALFGGLSSIAMLFLAAKRLKDIGWSPLLALALLVPAFSFVGLVALSVMPSKTRSIS